MVDLWSLEYHSFSIQKHELNHASILVKKPQQRDALELSVSYTWPHTWPQTCRKLGFMHFFVNHGETILTYLEMLLFLL